VTGDKIKTKSFQKPETTRKLPENYPVFNFPRPYKMWYYIIGEE
jgi:hypothetical protein